MTNNGGKIQKVGVWQQAVAAGAITTGATIQNTSILNGPEFDPNGINDGPPLLIWPFSQNPNDVDGNSTNRVASLADGALLARRPGDTVGFTGTQTAAVYVMCQRPFGTFAVALNP